VLAYSRQGYGASEPLPVGSNEGSNQGRHVRKPDETCGELLEAFEGFVPDVDLEILKNMKKSRGRTISRSSPP